MHHETGHAKTAISPLASRGLNDTLSFKHQFVPLLLYADSLNSNLSDRTDVCLTSFRAATGADGISLRTETHWQRALPVKFQFVAFSPRLFTPALPGGILVPERKA